MQGVVYAAPPDGVEEGLLRRIGPFRRGAQRVREQERQLHPAALGVHRSEYLGQMLEDARLGELTPWKDEASLGCRRSTMASLPRN